MANSFAQIIVHTTFHVKDDCSMATSDTPRLCDYIGGIVRNLGGTLLAAGGTHNHIHLLLTVPKTIALSDYLMKIKSNSSRWVKTLGGTYRAFGWQDGYGAFSVSASKISSVKAYIGNQEEHHKKMSYTEEVEAFFKAYDLGHVPPLRGSEE